MPRVGIKDFTDKEVYSINPTFWYPKPRRIFGALKFAYHKDAIKAQAERHLRRLAPGDDPPPWIAPNFRASPR